MSVATTVLDPMVALFQDTRFHDLAQTPYGSLRELIAATLVHQQITDPVRAWAAAVGSLNYSQETVICLWLSDLPRYQGPLPRARDMVCSHILTAGDRRGQNCARTGVESAKIYAPDGTWTFTWRCAQHRGELWALQQEASDQVAGQIPEPLPNRGGLLPAYLSTYDWERAYRSVSPSWHPPRHGIDANHWHTAVTARPASLRLVHCR